MSYGRLLMALAIPALAACSKVGPATNDAAKPLDVIGVYKSEWSNETDKEYLRIEPNRLTLVRVCKASYVGRALHAVTGAENKAQIEITVPARVSETTIEILGDAEKRATEVNSDCTVKLSKGTITYLFDYYRDLHLSRAGKFPTRYLRLGAPAPNYAERISQLPVRAANALGAPEIHAYLQKDSGVLVTDVNEAMSKDVGTAVTNLKGAVADGARKALVDIGNAPPVGP